MTQMRLPFVLSSLASLASAGSEDVCAGCVILTGLWERLAMRDNTGLPKAVSQWCDDIAPNCKDCEKVCSVAFDLLVPKMEPDFLKKISPDVTCRTSFGICANYSTCTLYEQWPPPPPNASTPSLPVPVATASPASSAPSVLDGLSADVRTALEGMFGVAAMAIGVESSKGRDFLLRQAMLKGGAVAGDGVLPIVAHLPMLDRDKDRFSDFPGLRGSDWRGKDCNDTDSAVYPGRLVGDDGDKERDTNCNGISGVDPADGVSFETKWCKDSGQRGIIALGDSATAHFRIPPDWLDGLTVNNSTYTHAIPLLENELDWPMCSSTTAHRNKSYCPHGDLPITSIYAQLLERNKCNHRDFQNLGVNGGSTQNMIGPNNVLEAMKARNGTDQPATVIYAVIGNDVCSGHPGTSHMTTPAKFESAVLTALDYLEAHLAPDSHVVFAGLVDGRLLYNTMHALQHPIGTPYSYVYDFLNCLEISPCYGWMNSNATMRNVTSQRAAELSAVYPKIIAEKKGQYKNFDMFYIDTFVLLDQVWAQWIAAGHQARDLIEPTDGFHPSQTANSLLATNMWALMQANFSQAIGPVNPFNDAITKQFGDQGGY